MSPHPPYHPTDPFVIQINPRFGAPRNLHEIIVINLLLIKSTPSQGSPTPPPLPHLLLLLLLQGRISGQCR